MKPRWLLAALTATICLLAMSPLLISHPYQDVALLERLAPRIERAQFIAPETHDAIMQLVERIQREAIGQPHDARRQAVIERVSHALRAKDDVPTLTSVGQGDAAQ